MRDVLGDLGARLPYNTCHSPSLELRYTLCYLAEWNDLRSKKLSILSVRSAHGNHCSLPFACSFHCLHCFHCEQSIFIAYFYFFINDNDNDVAFILSISIRSNALLSSLQFLRGNFCRYPQYRKQGQTTTPGSSFPSLCKKCVGSLTSPANPYREDAGDGAYGLSSLFEKTRSALFDRVRTRLVSERKRAKYKR